MRIPEDRRLLIPEFVLLAAIFVGDVYGYVPISKTIFLFLLGWASLRMRGLRWADVGFESPAKRAPEARRPPSDWRRAIALSVAFGIGLVLLELYVTYPLMTHIAGTPPDLSDFRPVTGNLKMLLLWVVLLWLLAAFGEEMVYRGYLMNRVAGLFSGEQRWLVSLVLVSVLFGMGHIGQGLPGMIENCVHGLLLGGLYLACGRNLVAPILAHGTSNTIDMVLIYLGTMPGL